MDIAINQIDFNVALNALQEEVVSRLQQFNVIQIEFLRQFQCHHTAPETHPSLIFNMRKILATIEDVYEGIKGYFIDLKMQVTFQLFRKIQIFMVNGYNYLARALLFHIDSSEEKKNAKDNAENREILLMKCQEQKLKHNQIRSSRKLQHCDYTIGFFQNQEAKIAEQMHKVQESLLLSRKLVEGLCPSKAVKQLTEIKEQAQITLQNTQKIFQQTYQLKYVQFKNYLSKMIKPEDIANQFCESIKSAMHEGFTKSVKKSVYTLKQMIKQEESLLLRENSTQTDDIQIRNEKKQNVSKNTDKMQNLLLKERRINQKQAANLQIMKKEFQIYKKDKQKLNVELGEVKNTLCQTQQDYRIMTKLYEERREEVKQLQNSLGMQAKMINDLKIHQWKYQNKEQKETQTYLETETFSREIQVGLQDQQQLIAAMRKRLQKLRYRILELEQKQERDAKAMVRKKNKKQTKLNDPPANNQVYERSNVRKRTQKKKTTIFGTPAQPQQSESSKYLRFSKKLSNSTSKMKDQMQIAINQQSIKLCSTAKLSKFAAQPIKKNSLKGICEVQISENLHWQKQQLDQITQTLQPYRVPEQSVIKTDKSIQACQDTDCQSVSNFKIKDNVKLPEYSKSLNSTPCKNSQRNGNALLKNKQNQQPKPLEIHKKQKIVFRNFEDNFRDLQKSMLLNSTTSRKQHFQVINIQNQQKNLLAKRNIMQKTNRNLQSHKTNTKESRLIKNKSFQEKYQGLVVTEEKKTYRKKQCLINVDKIKILRSFQVDSHQDTVHIQQIMNQAEEQHNK